LLEKTGLANFSLLVEFLIESLFVEAPQLALYVGFFSKASLLGPHPNLLCLWNFLLKFFLLRPQGLFYLVCC